MTMVDNWKCRRTRRILSKILSHAVSRKGIVTFKFVSAAVRDHKKVFV
jgi:hypothetical protein